ncbi:MAG: DNA polymerase IV [Candidatus Methanomethylophilaceae archaeon]|nr:DNA polymerase IV [Candidatus Methanomethylophilaceae archaeon]
MDMDCYYASVEMREDPSLKNRPVAILSPADQVQVVGTCNYPAREMGLHSGMSVSEARRLCPSAVFINGDLRKYRAVSEELHRLWSEYTDIMEPVMLDEAYLDVTNTARDLDEARRFAHEIQRRVLEEMGMGCSVGLGYNMVSAKTGSEELKPNGYFEILSPEDFVDLMEDRDIGEVNSIGPRTSEKLGCHGIRTVRDVRENRAEVASILGSQAKRIIDLADGIDMRPVTPRIPEDAKSISRSLTFLKDIDDYWLLSDVVFLVCVDIANVLEGYGKLGNGIGVAGAYSGREPFGSNKMMRMCRDPVELHESAMSILDEIPFRPVRRIGVYVYNLVKQDPKQRTLDSLMGIAENGNIVEKKLESMRKRYDLDALSRESVDRDTIRSIAEHMRTHRGRRRSYSLNFSLSYLDSVPSFLTRWVFWMVRTSLSTKVSFSRPASM